MPNMGSLVSMHSTRLLMEDRVQQSQGCNCLNGPDSCPLTPAECTCKKDKVIYVASVSTQNSIEHEHYTGFTGDTEINSRKDGANASQHSTTLVRGTEQHLVLTYYMKPEGTGHAL